MTIEIRTFALSTAKGVELGTFDNADELGAAFVAHFGKGYIGLAKKLVAAIKYGKDTTRMESVLGVRVRKGYRQLAA